jgi:hypothetical protein
VSYFLAALDAKIGACQGPDSSDSKMPGNAKVEANLLSFNQGGWLGVRKIKKEIDARDMDTPESSLAMNRLKSSTLGLKKDTCFGDAQKVKQGRIQCRFSRDSRNKSLLSDH